MSLKSEAILRSLLFQSEFYRYGHRCTYPITIHPARSPLWRCADNPYCLIIQIRINPSDHTHISNLSFLVDNEIHQNFALNSVTYRRFRIFQILLDPFLKESGHLVAIQERRPHVTVIIGNDVIIRRTS